MRLQNLEVKGFKSFADKTVVNFNKDIIGIVGPNGCGKSNIVDAIRWVLGEQKSSQLRSDKMTNVIFNGTKNRKQGNIAEVSLTFDNDKNILPTEYSTVTITRQLYRTGESEYRINGVPCRLKDIKTLFLDTGIGSNSYAIIALGMVDDLLADRENSRRRLFEQAAGISKYKARKKETLLKLSGTTTDLERVEDLLFEIDGNLKRLERQAKRAKKYFEIKESYKEQSLDLALFQIQEHKLNYKTVEAKIKIEEDNLLKINTESTQFEANLEKAKAGNIEQEQALNDKQRKLSQTVGNIRNKENDKKMLAQRIQFIQQNQTTLTQDIDQTKNQIEQTEIDIDYYRGEVNTEKRIEETLENQLENVEERLENTRKEHGSLKTELDDFITNQQQLERAIFNIEKEKAIQNAQIGNSTRDIDSTNREIEVRQKDVANLEERRKAQYALQAEKETLINALQQVENQRQEQLNDTENLIDKVREDLTKVNRQVDSKRNEYNLIKSLVDNLEGFPESIKFLNKNKNWDKQAPLLSDIFYCSPEYRVSIENYLEPYLSYYVVKNLEEALSAIQLLDKSKKGKANFFLLDAFTNNQSTDIQLIEGTVKALAVVQFDVKYKGLADNILGNVLINDAEDNIEPLTTENAIVLSKSGKYIQKRYSISGGSVGAFEGKRIGRKKNLELLSKEIADLQIQKDKLSVQFQELQTQQKRLKDGDKQRDIKRETELLSRLKQETVSIQTRLENFETYLKEAKDKKEQAERRIKNIETKIIEFDKQLEIKQLERQALANEIAKKDSSYRVIADKLNKVSEEYNQQNIAFIKQQNKITTLQRELNFREKQVRDLTIKLETSQRNLAKSETELQEAEQGIQTLDKELIDLYGLKSDNQAYLTAAEETYYKSRGTINEIEENIRQYNRQTNQTQQIISNLKDGFNDVKMKLTSIGERLKIEFEMSINDLMNQSPNPELDRQQLEEAVGKLRGRLNNYGEINPMAVEAYDEMSERHIFIKEQRDDLLSAKKTLLDTIEEIESKATAQFLEAFNQVRDSFKKVFRTLFTEDDDCDLVLEDPDNPLESVIKITAKPKGKRPQTINQLSGGEKTLTATALLFSLYLLKPAPFCIFDEVDAPLDDANITKFNKIIKEFSADSQFIIVTHNKQTMAAVDVIYGVTMAEQGVSRVVPVDFRTLAEQM
jgi:chromosome segregation protein